MRPISPRLVVHAGVHRTGSTSLQRHLAANRAALRAQGVVYAGDVKNHQALAARLRRGEAGADDVLALVREAGDARLVILSAEDFAIHRALDWLDAVAQRIEVTAVVYLRRQDHWVMSWYNQHVKWPFDAAKSRMTPDAFLARVDQFHWIDYATLLERWRLVVGREKLEVGVVERGQIEDVTADFLARLGVAADLLPARAKRANDSLPPHLLEIARNLGLIDLAPPQRQRLLAALQTALADKASPAHTVYSPAERRGILARFAESNRRVARTFFGREELFDEPPPADDEPYYVFPDLDRERLLREWVAPVVKDLLHQRQ